MQKCEEATAILATYINFGEVTQIFGNKRCKREFFAFNIKILFKKYYLLPTIAIYLYFCTNVRILAKHAKKNAQATFNKFSTKMTTIILHIEASTDVCSVALSQDGYIFFERVNRDERSHAKVLAPFVEEALENADSQGAKINAVALSCGPGSYTSLRIASSTAKGVCYGRNIPLIAIHTTAIMAVPVLFREEIEEEALLCPMIDARRNEVYATVYDRALNVIKETHAEVVTPESYKELLDRQPVYFFGNGAGKCKDIISHPNARFIDEHKNPLARNMMPLAEKAWFNEKFEDIAYFEPFYLKNFIASQPKKLL